MSEQGTNFEGPVESINGLCVGDDVEVFDSDGTFNPALVPVTMFSGTMIWALQSLASAVEVDMISAGAPYSTTSATDLIAVEDGIVLGYGVWREEVMDDEVVFRLRVGGVDIPAYTITMPAGGLKAHVAGTQVFSQGDEVKVTFQNAAGAVPTANHVCVFMVVRYTP